MSYKIHPTLHNLARPADPATHSPKKWYKIRVWVVAPWNGSFPYHDYYFESNGMEFDFSTGIWTNLNEKVQQQLVKKYGKEMDFELFSIQG